MRDEKDEKEVVEGAVPTATTLKQALDVMAITLQIGHVPCLWGLPGIGKTASVRGYTDWLELLFMPILGSIMEPPDIIGYPVAGGDVLKRLPEEWVHRVTQRGSLVLFDDLTTLYPSMQSAMLRVIHEKRVGDVDLSKVKMACAANPPHCAPNGRPLAAALANRMTHIDVVISGLEWGAMRRVGFQHAVTPPRIESNWIDQKPWAEALVTTYVERSSTALHNMPKNVVDQGRAWASPRTWDFVIDHLAACRAAKVDDETRNVCIASCIGGTNAVPFIEYVKNQDLADPEVLLAAGYDAKFEQRADQMHCALMSLVTALWHNYTVDRFVQAMRVFSRAPLDVAAVAISPFRGKEPKGIEMTDELGDLYRRYADVG